jgi:hypothetical protein
MTNKTKKKHVGILGLGAAALLAGLLTYGETPKQIKEASYQSPSYSTRQPTQNSQYASTRTNYNLNTDDLYSPNRNRILGGLETRADSTLNLVDPTTLLAILLYKEGRECSTEEKVLIAYSAINRSRKKGKSLLDVALKDEQYSCFNSYDPRKGMKIKITDENYKDWQECINVAQGVLDGEYQDPSQGKVDHYFNPKIVDAFNPKEMKTPWKKKRLINITFPFQTKHKFYTNPVA